MRNEHCIGILLLYVTVLNLSYAGADHLSTCPAYCDQDGYWQTSFSCQDEEFCCGNVQIRFCCDNNTLAIDDDTDHIFICPKSSIWMFQWQVALGVMGTVILVMVVAACCCQCCASKSAANVRARHERDRRRRMRRSDGVSTISEDIPRVPSIFDPEAPHAFTPPDYESLPKSPPDYMELFGMEEGQSNPAFTIGDEEMSLPRTPAPPYSLHPPQIGQNENEAEHVSDEETFYTGGSTAHDEETFQTGNSTAHDEATAIENNILNSAPSSPKSITHADNESADLCGVESSAGSVVQDSDTDSSSCSRAPAVITVASAADATSSDLRASASALTNQVSSRNSDNPSTPRSIKDVKLQE